MYENICITFIKALIFKTNSIKKYLFIHTYIIDN